MRLRTMVIFAGALLLIGSGCQECGCDGGKGTSDRTGEPTKAPTIPPSNPVAEEQATSTSPQPGEASSASAPTSQKSAASQSATIRQTIPEPIVTDEEINDPGFNSNLPRTSRRALILLRKLQESGRIGQPNIQTSSVPHKPHDDGVRQKPL